MEPKVLAGVRSRVRYLGVAQFGQSARFGSEESEVRIFSPRRGIVE